MSPSRGTSDKGTAETVPTQIWTEVSHQSYNHGLKGVDV